MTKNKSLTKHNPLIFCIVTAFFFWVILLLSSLVFGLGIGIASNLTTVPEIFYDDYVVTTIVNSLCIIVMLIFAKATNTLETLTTRCSSIGHAAQIGAYPLVFIGIVAISMLADSSTNGYSLRPALNILFYILAMLSIGFLEEFVFRGIIAKKLIKHYGTNTKGVWKASIVSGIIFGLAHIGNAFGLPLFGVLVQTAVAVVLGILFAAIYYRTGSLWICVLIHAGINGASLLQGGFYDVGSMEEMIGSFTLLNLIPCITYFIPVPFLLRESKNFEVKYWFGE